jgi:hypothetical protein
MDFWQTLPWNTKIPCFPVLLQLHWRFNSGSGMEAVTFNAFHSTSGGLSHGHLGEILVSCSEMVSATDVPA